MLPVAGHILCTCYRKLWLVVVLLHPPFHTPSGFPPLPTIFPSIPPLSLPLPPLSFPLPSLRLLHCVMNREQPRMTKLHEVSGTFFQHLTQSFSLLLRHFLKLGSLLVEDEHRDFLCVCVCVCVCVWVCICCVHIDILCQGEGTEQQVSLNNFHWVKRVQRQWIEERGNLNSLLNTNIVQPYSIDTHFN